MSALAKTIGAKIDAGILPRQHPGKAAEQKCGAGTRCIACDAPIVRGQVRRTFRNRDGAPLRFHIGCYAIWEVQAARRAGTLADRGVTESMSPARTVRGSSSLGDAGMVGAVMPERLAIITALIVEHPMCASCIAGKTGMRAVAALQAALARMRTVLEVHWQYGRCRACGSNTAVVSVERPV